MHNKIVQLKFFPAEIPTPYGEKKRHEGLIQTPMENGIIASRPKPMDTYDYFEYHWQGITKGEFKLIDRFCKQYWRIPVGGWCHPGIEGDWLVIIPGQATLLSTFSDGQMTETCNCSVEIRIWKAGGI